MRTPIWFHLEGALWFIRESWPYLGCDKGAGRWRARRRYFLGIIPGVIWFVWQSRKDWELHIR